MKKIIKKLIIPTLVSGLISLIPALCWDISFAQGMLYEVPLSDRVQNAATIIEGKVISKSCFWNSDHTLIYTSNVVEVYKVFKGNITAAQVEIITEGGTVGNDMLVVNPGLKLREGEIGIFFANLSGIEKTDPQNSNAIFKLYASVQGFIKYDMIEKKAIDPFNQYANIQNDLYVPIIQQLNRNYIQTIPFTINK